MCGGDVVKILKGIAPPGNVLRRLASARSYGMDWGKVDSQISPTPGVSMLGCSGHGGLMVIDAPDEIDFDGLLLQDVRSGGVNPDLTRITVHLVQLHRRSRIVTGVHAWGWAEDLRDRGCNVASFGVWVGEEDCGWKSIYAALPDETRKKLHGGDAGFVGSEVFYDIVEDQYARTYQSNKGDRK